jgi:hypothetical protein
MDMTKFEDNNDPGYQSICAVLRRWIREYKESLTSNSNPATENTSKSHSNSPPWTSNQTPSINYSLNNTAGGMVIEGNNINSAGGPIHFGR